MPSTRPATPAPLRLALATTLVLLVTALTASPAMATGPTRASNDRLDDGLLLGGVGAGLPSDGVPSRPSRDVKSILRSQADAPATTGTLGPAAVPAFATAGYVQRAIPPGAHPYALAAPVPLTDNGVHDSQGVRMIRIGTRLFNHPVGQASYGLTNVASFDLTADHRYLDRAIAQADRLVATKIVSRDGWYFPYPFDFALHGLPQETMRAPWYSGMAQGMALSLFVELYRRTNDSDWLTAAAGTVASFRNGPSTGLPWVTHIDGQGYLWLEEYPREPASASDFTLNGHLFATFGLYDYATLSGDPWTTQLFDGAATTARHYGSAFAPDGFRIPSWLSAYCLRHGVLDIKYHGIVMNQLIAAHSLTADAVFARLSDTFRTDYPETMTSTVRFTVGTWTGYVFDSQGRILRSRTVGIRATSTAPADAYARIKGRGLYYRITAGSLKGYWIAERTERVHAVGQYGTARYYPDRHARFRAGTTTGYRFDANGLRSSSRAITLSASSSAPFDQTAMFGGRRYARITAGGLAGYWVPTANVSLD